MRNMKSYDLKDSFEVYKEAVERKDNVVIKMELKSIENQVGECYSNYERYFNQNDLHHMPEARVGKEHKEALLGMYNSKSKLIKDFRTRYFDINPQAYYNLCPYCVINSSNTTEHILPKEKYPECAINVKNLIPGCGECNSDKSDRVVDEQGEKLFINFYTDKLPDEQFLFVDITDNGGELRMRYRLENLGGKISDETYALIERHFDKLHLLDKYDIKAIQEIAEIRNFYLDEMSVDAHQYDAYAAKQIRVCRMNERDYGINHWKIVLIKACASSEVFRLYIMRKVKAIRQ